MAIHFKCKCGNKMEAPEDFIGKEARCGVCGKYCVVPAHSEFVAEPTVKPKPGIVEDRGAAHPEPPLASGMQVAGLVGSVLGGLIALAGGVMGLAGHASESGSVVGIGLGLGVISLALMLSALASARR